MTSSRVRIVAAWSAAAVLGLGVAAAAGGIALANPSQEKAAAAAQPTAAKHRAAVRGIHGEFVVKKGSGFVTLLTQKGTVTVASAGSLTVKSADGFTATYSLDDKTTVKRRGEQGTATARTGDSVIVTATKGGDTAAAKRVIIRKK